MPAISVKHLLSIVISILLIFSLLLTAWQVSAIGVTLGLIFLLFALMATSYTIIIRQREAYRQGKITLFISIRNICLEIAAVLLAMILAGLLGHSLSMLVIRGITSPVYKLLAGIGIGLLAGWTVGLFVKRAAGRLVRNSTGR